MNDKQMDQWNLNPPVLYLWSRPGWTSKHKAIAQRQGHLEEKGNETRFLDSSITDRSRQGGVSSVSDNDIPMQNDRVAEVTKENSVVSEGRIGSFSRSNSRKEVPENQESQSNNGSRKRQRSKMPDERSHPSPSETNIKSPFNARSRKSSDMSLDADIGRSNTQPQHESLNPELDMDYAAGLDSIIEDIGRTYGLCNDDYPTMERLSSSLSPHPAYR